MFDGAVREAVHRLKYRHERARAEWAGYEMAAAMRSWEWTADCLVPVPLHPSRRRRRGYNQSECLSAAVSLLLDVPTRNALDRARATRAQVDLDADERRANVAQAFRANTTLDGVSVLLIDDVATTGATLNDCARACRDAGAARVRAVTLATQF